MVEVKVLFEKGEEKYVKEILLALENVHRKRFFFSWIAYERKHNMLKRNLTEDE